MPSVYLVKIKKQKGGRLKHLETFRATCNAADKSQATGWLIAKRSIKTPDEAMYDDFVHVLHSIMKDTQVVVKLQSASSVFERKEYTTLKYLADRKQNNIVDIICHFECNDTMLRWNNTIQTPTQFCKGGNDRLSLTVMEYVPLSLYDIVTYDKEVITNIIQHITLTIVEMVMTNAITHGDLNSGNIMIRKEEPIVKEYRIGNSMIQFGTYGYEPVFIDFQFAKLLNIQDVPTKFMNLKDDLGVTYNILSNTLVKYRNYLRKLSYEIDRYETVAQIIELIKNFRLKSLI
jgi:serine/threonine protein kinase